jgi:hypothetical protein
VSETILPATQNRGGFGATTFKSSAEKMRLIKRFTLSDSKDLDIIKIKAETDKYYVESEVLLSNCPSLTSAKPKLKTTQQDAAWSHILSLQIQGISARVLHSVVNKADIANGRQLWSG